MWPALSERLKTAVLIDCVLACKWVPPEDEIKVFVVFFFWSLILWHHIRSCNYVASTNAYGVLFHSGVPFLKMAAVELGISCHKG